VGSEQLINSLRVAVEAAPEDIPLRLHLAGMLAQAGERAEAVRHAAAVLQLDPANDDALRLIQGGAPTEPGSGVRATVGESDQAKTLRELDAQLADVVPPMFVEPGGDDEAAYDVERAGVRLGDVGGMETVKTRLEAAVLAPMRNPDLGRLYGKSLRGGLLLYGPPGCGKTFIARALAGEMEAGFLSVSLADVLDSFIGQSERNVHELFEVARRNAPCVVFLDEIDALGQKRGNLRGAGWLRGTVNQLLAEMDGVAGQNDGVFVLAATNHPWDVDVAMRRPGRLDRMLLVAPPDEPAREVILRYHLRDRPIASVDTKKLARSTDGYSGADLAYVCEAAAEAALVDSARTGNARLIEMRDLEQALKEVKPSIGPWLDTARNVAQFANEGGVYDELHTYLRRRRLI
jgi:SpoVK/Ycf46/Vps4 family AAA+-type ATPase